MRTDPPDAPLRRRRTRPLALVALLAVFLGCLVATANPAQAATLLSQGKPATASTSEGAGTAPAAAVDGDLNTRWSSTFSDPQWLQVDLGSTATISEVVLRWEAAYATAFQIQVSDNAQDWRSVYSTTTGPGGTQTLAVSGSGRYVRMLGTQRANGYGYSLWEFQVSGTPGGGNNPGNPGGGPGITRVTGTQGNWQLSVDGAPYVVKGLTWGPPVSEAASRMPDVKAMGVNTIRTWGTDAGSKPLFDAAAANGVKVVAGFWLQPGGGPGSGGCVNYVTDATYKANMLSEIQRWVTEYKAHQGVLMWNVGNESILGMQNCFSGTELENQRNAYARFVNDAARAIHAIDANHPVTNTDAWTGAWPYLKANAPDLDLYSVNAYNAVCNVRQDWINGGYTKPYIVTEGGPAGEWEVPNDANGVPTEPTDVAKRDGYLRAWNCITGHTGVALGATLFHYGTEGDFGGVWFNLIPNGEKRLSYYAVRQMYGGAAAANTPPVITNMALSRTTDVPAGGTFTLSANVSDPNGDPISYTIGLNSKYINGAGGIISAAFTGNGPFTVTAPQMLGVWKVYLYARDGKGNIGIETKSFRVVPPPVQGTNIAVGKPTTASSYQQVGDGAPYPPERATDGNATTRWASDWSDPQWIRVDLGSVQTFNHVQLIWEAAFGKAYQIQASDDGNTWRDLYATTTGDGGADDVDVTATARYVRVNATQRGTAWGYALYELGVYRR
ncbi:discoidin domain-containing protein [Umezawaea tangerina]|uniref:Glycosyl hydrolase family 2 n=1 Tax=Umezawaea tangerina TaxID=84725 RepID=A0A2T0THM0_9PSEU|nr:discoidin domain-containing protein [Umezawaea tangerina]PRY45105.1 glycosyl hydrolase family 2 [Umezawaea tangerina]